MSRILKPGQPPRIPLQKQFAQLQAESAALMRYTTDILRWCDSNLTEEQKISLYNTVATPPGAAAPPSPILKPH